jgi:hypothetical protein
MPEAIANEPVTIIEATATEQPKPAPRELPQLKAVPATAIKNPWICFKCGAILGSVHQDKIRQGLSVTRLIIFREAVDLTEHLPENFVFGKVDAGEFGCSRCGTVREWRPSEEALRFLSEKRRTPKKNRNV